MQNCSGFVDMCEKFQQELFEKKECVPSKQYSAWLYTIQCIEKSYFSRRLVGCPFEVLLMWCKWSFVGSLINSGFFVMFLF